MVYVEVACRSLVGLAFAAAVAGKLSGRRAFAEFAESPIIARRLPGRGRRRARSAVAAAVLAVELAIVTLLALPGTAAAGLLVGAGTLVVFTAAVLGELRSAAPAPCRCFGRGRRPPSRVSVARNATLFGACAVGAMAALADAPSPQPAGVAVAAAAGAVLAAVVVGLDDIAVVLRTRPSTS